jgi:hypothetical protein
MTPHSGSGQTCHRSTSRTCELLRCIEHLVSFIIIILFYFRFENHSLHGGEITIALLVKGKLRKRPMCCDTVPADFAKDRPF